MKYKISIFAALIATILLVVSCEKYVEGYDESPNSPTEVTPALLLAASEVALQVAYTGQLARTPAILTQQIAGVSDQMLDVQVYRLGEGDNQNEWNSIYTDVLETAQDLIDTYGEENAHYKGIAQIVKAMGLGLATDTWGDIPNREALMGIQGEAFHNPAFDAQETVIQDIQALLDEAIVNLQTGSEANTLFPGTDDILFSGDLSQWIITANILKARYAIRLTKKGESAAATNALTHIAAARAAGMINDSVYVDCDALWGTGGNELSQWYAFDVARPAYIRMGGAFVDLLTANVDPRLPYYASPDLDGGYSGTALGSTDNSSSPIGPYINTADAPLPLVTYAEALFIEAEAEFRSGDAAAAAAAHNEAVLASVRKVTGGEADSTFTADFASESATSISLETIMTQKHIALFSQPEVWTDWRRTGVPTLTPEPGGVTSTIPRRLPHPLEERLYNTSAGSSIVSNTTSPVWWDEN